MIDKYHYCNSLKTYLLIYHESADIRLEMAAGLSGIKGTKEGSNCELVCSVAASIFNANQS